MKIEIACFNLESALIADRVGADRIELCKKYSEGGTTPNLKMAIEARSKIKAPLFVMIRPRGGNFTYSEDEFTEMKISITELKNSVDGFVFGILNEDLTINILQNTELVKLANPLPCTFHRAFDKVHDTSKSLEEIIECGFKTILTSGTMPNVMEGKTELRSLVEKAGSRITIMPGGGLRASNLMELHKFVGAEFYHSSAITDNSDVADDVELSNLMKLSK